MTALTVVKGGISRLRQKGAAPEDVLFDGVNGYVTAQKTFVVRPGTFRRAVLPSITKGLVAFDGSKHVFASEHVDVPAGYTLHILVHPEFEGGTANPFEIRKIHFAAPFLGFLYVVAEFDVGDTGAESVYHYWLQSGGAWQASHIYKHGDVIEPTVPTGLAYEATRLSAPNISWAPHAPRTVGDVVEPTVYNDFFYTVIDTLGSNPASGAVEPIWPEVDGGQVSEDTDADALTSTTTTQPPANVPGSDVTRRYGDPGPNNGVQP